MNINRRGFIVGATAPALVGVAPAVSRPIGLIQMEQGSFHAGGTSEDPYQDYRGRIGMRAVFNNGTATAWMTYPVELLTARGGAASVEVCTWSMNAMRAIMHVPFDLSVCQSVIQHREQEKFQANRNQPGTVWWKYGV